MTKVYILLTSSPVWVSWLFGVAFFQVAAWNPCCLHLIIPFRHGMNQSHQGESILSHNSWTSSYMWLLLTFLLTTTQLHVTNLISRKAGTYFLATCLELSHDVVSTYFDMIFCYIIYVRKKINFLYICIYTNTKKKVWKDMQ